MNPFGFTQPEFKIQNQYVQKNAYRLVVDPDSQAKESKRTKQRQRPAAIRRIAETRQLICRIPRINPYETKYRISNRRVGPGSRVCSESRTDTHADSQTPAETAGNHHSTYGQNRADSKTPAKTAGDYEITYGQNHADSQTPAKTAGDYEITYG
ncbi:MAG TPA: hypothetical protein VF345_11660 [Chthoniobacterales bacterium]